VSELGGVEFLGAVGDVASGYSTLLGAIAAPEFFDVRQAGYGSHAGYDCRKVFERNRRLAKAEFEVGLLRS
jgi:ABC-type phosphonate transport system ATPase subunit